MPGRVVVRPWAAHFLYDQAGDRSRAAVLGKGFPEANSEFALLRGQRRPQVSSHEGTVKGLGPFWRQTARDARDRKSHPTRANCRQATPRMRARLSAAAKGYPEGKQPLHPQQHATPRSSRSPAAPTACGHRPAVRWPGRPARAPGPGRFGQASWKLQQRCRQHRQLWLFARKPTGRGWRRWRVPPQPGHGGRRDVPC